MPDLKQITLTEIRQRFRCAEDDPILGLIELQYDFVAKLEKRFRNWLRGTILCSMLVSLGLAAVSLLNNSGRRGPSVPNDFHVTEQADGFSISSRLPIVAYVKNGVLYVSTSKQKR